LPVARILRCRYGSTITPEGAVTRLSSAAGTLRVELFKEARLDIPVFYLRSEFFNVDGIAVSLGNCDSDEVPLCAAWDVSPPRRFDADIARARGKPLSLRQFHRLVGEAFAAV
jgi:hypothetical protein